MTAVTEPPRLPRTVPDWHDQGTCRLFPELDFVEAKGAAELACRVVCRVCPVRMLCATNALERGEPWGIWGGLDRRDRKKLAAELGYPVPAVLPEHGTNARYAKHGCPCPECRAAHTLYESERRITVRRKAKQRGLWVSPLAVAAPITIGHRRIGAGQLLLPLSGVPVPPWAEASAVDTPPAPSFSAAA